MKGIILRDFEVRRLASAGSVLIWRRVNPQPCLDFQTGFRIQNQYPLYHHPKCSSKHGMLCDCGAIDAAWRSELESKCPHGSTGETRFVKETFVDGYPSDCGELQMFDEHGNELPIHVWYRSDEKLVSQLGAPMEEWLDDDGAPIDNIPWRSPVHMTEALSRFRVTLSVSCRQIQSVTEEEAEMCYHDKHPSPSRIPGSLKHRAAISYLLEQVYPGCTSREDWFWAIEAKEVK